MLVGSEAAVFLARPADDLLHIADGATGSGHAHADRLVHVDANRAGCGRCTASRRGAFQQIGLPAGQGRSRTSQVDRFAVGVKPDRRSSARCAVNRQWLAGLEERALLAVESAQGQINWSIAQADAGLLQRRQNLRPASVEIGEPRCFHIGLKQLPQPPGEPGEQIAEQKQHRQPDFAQPVWPVTHEFPQPEVPLQVAESAGDDDQNNGMQHAIQPDMRARPKEHRQQDVPNRSHDIEDDFHCQPTLV